MLNSHSGLLARPVSGLSDFLVRVLLPDGGLVAVFTRNADTLAAYFDESMTSQCLPLMSVAGYVFEADPYLRFDAEMGELLHEFNLEYFRFAERNQMSGQFEQHKDDPRDIGDVVGRRVISLIRRYAVLRVGVSASEATFQIVRPVESDGSLYNRLCQWCLWEVGKWADRNRFSGKIAYFFEAGADDQHHTDGNLHKIKFDTLIEQRCHYGSHSFIAKRQMRGLQVADALAWFVRREGEDTEALSRGRMPLKRRADFQALIGTNERELKDIEHLFIHLDESRWRAHFAENSWPETRLESPSLLRSLGI